MTELRVLNDSGLVALRKYLTSLKENPTLAPPTYLLTDFRYADAINGHPRIEAREFQSKYDFGCYMYQTAKSHDVAESLLRRSTGLWAWLVLFYLDQVCPQDGNGRRKVLSIEKYIASAGHIATGLDKHLLFFPWKMVALHGSDAAWLLSGQLREDTKVMRELANSYRRNVSNSFIKLAKSMYFAENERRLRKGATTNRPGSLRRLDRVVSQLDLTYDVFGMDPGSLAKLLPANEFERWLPESDVATLSLSEGPGL